MSRILLADDSPHAQRMGERILREEGFEVVTVTDGETALIRLADVDPDVLLADVFLPHKSGYEICDFVKSDPRFRHTRVVLLAGLLEPVDQAQVERVKADAVLKKPFEASVMIATLRPLVEAARLAREVLSEQAAPVAEQPARAVSPPPNPPLAEAAAAPEAAPAPPEVEIDRERLRAAVTIALDQAMPALIDELTERVAAALRD
jgi:CheY-like chemotaxis protein